MRNIKNQLGQSIIEVVVAIAIFTMIASSAIVTILGSFLTTRHAEEESKATTIAAEGIAAIESIRNKDWSNLVDGTYGISNSSGEWEFSGSSNTDGKYTRSIVITSVERVGGEIVDSGGTVDNDTKKITVSVNWDFNPGRPLTIEMTTYLTNWQEATLIP